MKIREIIVEADESEYQRESTLVPILLHLYHRSKDKGLTPRIKTESLINLVKNTCDSAFDYDALATEAQNNETVKNLLSKFELVNKDGEPETFDDAMLPDMNNGMEDQLPNAEIGLDQEQLPGDMEEPPDMDVGMEQPDMNDQAQSDMPAPEMDASPPVQPTTEVEPAPGPNSKQVAHNMAQRALDRRY